MNTKPRSETTKNVLFKWHNFSVFEDVSTGQVSIEGKWPEINLVYDEDYYFSAYIKKREERSELYRKIAETALDSKKGKLLDIGCGAGLFLAEVDRLGCVCAGIDPSKAACDLARKNTMAKIVNAAPLSLPPDWKTEEFDVVTILDVLAHVDSPRDFLLWAKRRIRKGGRILLKTPNRPAEYYRYIAAHYPQNHKMAGVLSHIPYQKFGWGKDALFNLFTSSGFINIRIAPVEEACIPYKFSLNDLCHPRRIVYKYQLKKAAATLKAPSLLVIANRA
jgi:SAM-dependent methyltransferase